jgi:VWFA-related protein
MNYKSASRFIPLALAAAFCLNSLTAPAQSQSSPPKERPRLKDFGSSLKRLKWDEKRKAAVETEDRKAGKGGDADEEVVKVETSLVACDVLVLDERGRAVQGLTRDDFIVTEDGRPQRIEVFAPGGRAAIPRSIVLIIDYSTSQFPYLETSIEAAKTLVDKLDPADRMAVVTDDLKLLTEFTQDKRRLKEKLDSVRHLAQSEARDAYRLGAHPALQYSALLATLRELFDEEDLRPVIIFQTDGDEFWNLKRTDDASKWPPVPPKRQFSLADIYKAAERSRVTVYSVIVGLRLMGLPPEEQARRARVVLQQQRDTNEMLSRPLNMGAGPLPSRERLQPLGDLKQAAEWIVRAQAALAGLAEVTGGWADFLEKPSQAEGIYTRIFSDVNERLVVGYYPTNKEHDGKRRSVKIEVRGHPEYTVRGRKSDYAPGPEE